MVWKVNLNEGTEVKYDVLAYYTLRGKTSFLRVRRDSVEECRQWLDEHRSKEIEDAPGVWKAAFMTSYNITKITTTKEIIERVTC